MIGAFLAVVIAAQAGAEWVSVHDDDEAVTSIDARTIGRAGQNRTVAVRTMFKDAAAGGFIHEIELDCAADRVRAIHETILDAQGARVIDGPALSSSWVTPPEEAPFSAVLRRVCAAAN